MVKVIIKVNFVICFLAINFGELLSQTSWSRTLDNLGTFSSPRTADLNGDGVKDILFGAGRQEFISCDSSVVALDGESGELLWTTGAIDQMFGSALLIDIDDDLVNDVIIGGRSGELIAINGKSGKEIWRFYEVNDLEKIGLSKIYNFYNPQLIPDQDEDGVQDIIISNGGDVLVKPHDPDRPAGHLIVVSGATGSHISHAAMPDGKESYMSVSVIYNEVKEDHEIIFGTGGETIGGSLFVDYLSSVMAGDLSSARVLHTSPTKGYISPVARVDLNGDEVLDILVSSVDGRLACIDGVDFEIDWELKVPETEAYSMPCIGHFNDDDTPDIFISYGQGIWPNIEWGIQKMINGKTGVVEYTNDIGYYQSSSPIAVDLTGDGVDEVMMSINLQSKDSLGFRIVQNSLVGIEFNSKEVIYLSKIEMGSNLATTPWVGDLEQDGFLDFIYFHGTNPRNYNFDGMKIHRIVTQIPLYKELKWSAYQGSNYNGIFHVTKPKVK